jgi:hypothetical protein
MNHRQARSNSRRVVRAFDDLDGLPPISARVTRTARRGRSRVIVMRVGFPEQLAGGLAVALQVRAASGRRRARPGTSCTKVGLLFASLRRGALAVLVLLHRTPAR